MVTSSAFRRPFADAYEITMVELLNADRKIEKTKHYLAQKEGKAGQGGDVGGWMGTAVRESP